MVLKYFLKKITKKFLGLNKNILKNKQIKNCDINNIIYFLKTYFACKNFLFNLNPILIFVFFSFFGKD